MQFNSRCLSRAVTRDVRESTQGKQPRAREPRGDIRAAIFSFRAWRVGRHTRRTTNRGIL